MSMPRAAMSVATRATSLPSLNSVRARTRAPWVLLPCRAAERMPSLSRRRERASAPCLVRVKISTWFQPRFSKRCSSTSFFFSRSTWMTFWLTVSTVVLRRATSMDWGSCRKLLASSLISSEKVAEKSRFWRLPLGGSRARILRMSRMKPMSSMRSASSRTRISMPERSRVRWLMWSSRRPGQATRMSTPRFRAAIWGFMPTPPNMDMDFRGRCWP